MRRGEEERQAAAAEGGRVRRRRLEESGPLEVRLTEAIAPAQQQLGRQRQWQR